MNAKTPLRTYLPVLGVVQPTTVEVEYPGLTLDEVVSLVISRDYENVAKVLFVDEEAGICRDDTRIVAEAIVATAINDDLTLADCVITFCECHIKGCVPAWLREAA